ncbi:MAG: glycogen debranching protein [Blautia sp.]|nr:glycogen debranching protein [Blautia sp.]
MRINLNRIPYSKRNSYMVISELKDEYSKGTLESGLYLRTVHGSASRSIVARLTPLFDGKEEAYETDLELTSLVISHGDQKIEVCYDDENTLLFRGSAGTGLKIDFLTEKYRNDYIYDIKHRAYTLYMANCYKNNCRYLIWALKEKISLEQEWEDNIALYSRIKVSSPDGFMVAVQEVETEWDGKVKKVDFATCKNNNQEDFLEFLHKVPYYPLTNEEPAYLAAYLEWSSFVRENGFLTHDTMLVSKNWLADKSGWNLGLNALALSYKDPNTAWAQFMMMFDLIDETGRIPDSFNDSYVKWNHCKPPFHGWILSKMMEHMELSHDQLIEAYVALRKSTFWWLRYRDFRHQGLFVYDHAKDSGWDNSTVFSLFPPISSPDLQALLILQMDMIAKLAEKLNIEDDVDFWKEKSRKLLENFLNRCFVDNLPVPIHSNTGDIVSCDSLLPYEILVLGDLLPEEIRNACITALKSDKFCTAHGFATESPQSPLYQSDKKCRGPIWPPATIVILDGLVKSGAKDFAQAEAEKFVNLVQEKGLAENYDALTGDCIGPYIHTWTASAYLIILKEFIQKK